MWRGNFKCPWRRHENIRSKWIWKVFFAWRSDLIIEVTREMYFFRHFYFMSFTRCSTLFCVLRHILRFLRIFFIAVSFSLVVRCNICISVCDPGLCWHVFFVCQAVFFCRYIISFSKSLLTLFVQRFTLVCNVCFFFQLARDFNSVSISPDILHSRYAMFLFCFIYYATTLISLELKKKKKLFPILLQRFLSQNRSNILILCKTINALKNDL